VARTALRGRLTWQLATVVELTNETPQVKNIALEHPDWPGHRPGEHVDVRLTAEDGYQAQRSYSIASSPEDEELMLTVERLEAGEVSPYLVDELRPGDSLELRGPIGGYFIWEPSLGGPLFLIAGGSGIVPLRAMLRHRAAVRSSVPARLLYSSRSVDDVIYREDLNQLDADDQVDIRLTLSRKWPEKWGGHRGRVDTALLAEVSWAPAERPLTYVCGPTGFVETVANGLVDLGHDPARIRTERFGPTGRE
jgi:ferredoxin-NADP reductase